MKRIFWITVLCFLFFSIFSFASRSNPLKELVFSPDGPLLESPHSQILNISDEITLEAEIYVTQSQHEQTRILDKFQKQGAGGFFLAIGKQNKLWAMIGNNSLVSQVPIPLNKQVNVTATFSCSKGIFKVFVDGILSGEYKSKISPINKTNFPIRIGHDADFANRFTGSIKRIAIYEGVLDSNSKISSRRSVNKELPMITGWNLVANAAQISNLIKGREKLVALKKIIGAVNRAVPANYLWYDCPAKQWTDALPIGNGRLGAMIFGRPEHERLQLNEVTIWSGGPQQADRKNAYTHLPEIRKLIREGKYDKAQQLTDLFMTSPAPYNASYQTLGELALTFQHPAGDITQYRRSLDISQAISRVEYRVGKTDFTREVFSSAPDKAIVMHITASQKGKVSFKLDLDRLERTVTSVTSDNQLLMKGSTGASLDFEVQVKVKNIGGKHSATNNELLVSGADEVTIYIVAGSSYILDYKNKYRGEDPHQKITKELEQVAAKNYNLIKNTHVSDYKRLFDRVTLDLGKHVSDKTTSQRLKEYGNGTNDPGFAALFYQYGRYLLISSSRSDNPLPSNSQGIWGDGLVLPWMADYKSNINYQMNYWSAEPTNLSELHLPMLRVTQSLQEPGAQTARTYFGPDTPGWYYGYTTNAWGWTSPGAHLAWGVFAGGSGWACQHLWEHYAFTRDKKYLKDIYPVLKGACEFYLATMVTDENGKLITSPSTSPENEFVTDGGIKSNVAEGNTMERAIIWDLFNNTQQAAEVLGEKDAFYKSLVSAKNLIRPLEIGRYGQLMEWGHDWDDTLSTHRHVSHLFPLHPGRQISTLGTPKLAAAARKSLEYRTDIGTGWSKAWKINFWARLREGNRAHKLLSDQLIYTENSGLNMSDGGGTYPNLFDAHPPFQIDGNFGAVAGITEMLVQSMENYATDRYIIDILPALPDAWRNGIVKGLICRGGFGLGMQWKQGKLYQAEIVSYTGEECRLRTKEAIVVKDIEFAQQKVNGFYITSFKTIPKAVYQVKVL